MSFENAILYCAWVSGWQGHLLLLVLVYGNIFTISLEASFNNSKYFKTAVKSTVTISPKIVISWKKYFFKSPLQSSSVYVFIFIYSKK